MRHGYLATEPSCDAMFDPGQRSLFLGPINSANTTEKRPLLASKHIPRRFPGVSCIQQDNFTSTEMDVACVLSTR